MDNSPIQAKAEVKADLTEVAKEIYKDGGKGFIQELGKTGQIILGTINNTLGLPSQFYNIWANSKIQEFKNKIENKLSNVASDDLIEPRMDIIAKSIDGLRYIPDEEELKEMFANLMVNSCNSRYSSEIHPRFVEIIKQLSTNDAILLKELSKNPSSVLPIADIITKTENGSRTLFPDYYPSTVLESEKIPPILNNLETLGIVKIDYNNFLVNENLYNPILESAIYKKLATSFYDVSITKGTLMLTAFGRNFVMVCID